MGITYVGSYTGAGSSTTATPTIPPIGIMTDDFLVLVVEGEGEDASDDSVPTGGAWTLVDSIASATAGGVDDTRVTVGWARYVSGLNVTVPDAGDHTIANIYVFRGVEATANVEAFTAGATVGPNTSHTVVTGLTTLTDGAMVVLGLAVGDDVTVTSVANASLTGVGEGGEFATVDGSDGTVNVLYGIKTTAGGAGSFTFTTSTSESIAWVALSLKPAGNEPRVDGAYIEAISEVTNNPRIDGAYTEVVGANAHIPRLDGVFIEVISYLGLQLDFIDDDEMYEPTLTSVDLEDNVYLREGATEAYYELEGGGGFFQLESAPNPPGELTLDFINEDEMYEPVMTKGPNTQIALDFIDEDAMYEPTMELAAGGGFTLDFIDEDTMYEPMMTLGVPMVMTLDFIDEDEVWEIVYTTPGWPPPVPREPGAQRFPAGGGFDDTRRRGFRPVSGGTTVRGRSGR